MNMRIEFTLACHLYMYTFMYIMNIQYIMFSKKTRKIYHTYRRRSPPSSVHCRQNVRLHKTRFSAFWRRSIIPMLWPRPLRNSRVRLSKGIERHWTEIMHNRCENYVYTLYDTWRSWASHMNEAPAPSTNTKNGLTSWVLFNSNTSPHALLYTHTYANTLTCVVFGCAAGWFFALSHSNRNS